MGSIHDKLPGSPESWGIWFYHFSISGCTSPCAHSSLDSIKMGDRTKGPLVIWQQWEYSGCSGVCSAYCAYTLDVYVSIGLRMDSCLHRSRVSASRLCIACDCSITYKFFCIQLHVVNIIMFKSAPSCSSAPHQNLNWFCRDRWSIFSPSFMEINWRINPSTNQTEKTTLTPF